MAKIPGKQIVLDTNPNLGTSDQNIPSQRAIKEYVDTRSSIMYTATIVASTPSPVTINHNLNSNTYLVNVYDNVTKEDIVVEVDRTDLNNVTISYTSNPNDLIVLIFAGGVVIDLGIIS